MTALAAPKALAPAAPPVTIQTVTDRKRYEDILGLLNNSTLNKERRAHHQVGGQDPTLDSLALPPGWLEAPYFLVVAKGMAMPPLVVEAMRRGALKLARRMLKRGAALEGPNGIPMPLRTAAALGSRTLVAECIQRGSIHGALGSAKTFGIVTQLLQAGADPNEPLAAVMLMWHLPKAALKLLEAGADPLQRDEENKTLLHIITRVQPDPGDALRYLVSKGIDPNCRDNSEMTPLFDAKTRRCAEQLIALGADADAMALSEVTVSKDMLQSTEFTPQYPLFGTHLRRYLSKLLIQHQDEARDAVEAIMDHATTGLVTPYPGRGTPREMLVAAIEECRQGAHQYLKQPCLALLGRLDARLAAVAQARAETLTHRDQKATAKVSPRL